MNQTKRLGLSLGIGISAGLMALVFGVLGAMMALTDSTLVAVLLWHLFPRTAEKIADRLHRYLMA